MSKEQEAIEYLKNYCEYDGEYDAYGAKPYYIDLSAYGLKNAYKNAVDTLEQTITNLEIKNKIVDVACEYLEIFTANNNEIDLFANYKKEDWKKFLEEYDLAVLELKEKLNNGH